jgi:phage baseplate assembly protein W
MALSTGINRETGKLLIGFDHVVQSIHVIFTTQLGERVMLRHFGAAGNVLLGRAMTAGNILRFFTLFVVAIETWEPRFKVTRVLPRRQEAETTRLGHMAFVIEGEYRPRGHLGDPTPEGTLRQIGVEASDNQIKTGLLR